MASSTKPKKTAMLDLSGTTFGAGATQEKLLELNTGTQSNIDLGVQAEKQKQDIKAAGSKIVGKGHSEFWDGVLSHNYTDGTLQSMLTRARAPDETDPTFTLAQKSRMIDNINASRQAQGKPVLTSEQTTPLLDTESEAQFSYFWTHMQNVEDERKWQQTQSPALEIASALTAGFGDITSIAGMGVGALAAKGARVAGAGSKAVSAVDFGADIATGIAGSRFASATAGEDHGLSDDVMAAGTAVAFKGIVDAGIGTAKLLSNRYQARQEALALRDNPIATATDPLSVPKDVSEVVQVDDVAQQAEVLRAGQDPLDTTPVATVADEVPLVGEDGTPILTDEVQAEPVEATPVDATPVDTTLEEATPVETAPVDITPEEATPVDITPVEATPVEVTPVAPETKPTLADVQVMLKEVDEALKTVDPSPRVSPKRREQDYALRLSKMMRKVKPADISLSKYLSTEEGQAELKRAEEALDEEYFKPQVETMPEDFVLKQEDLVDADKIMDEPEQVMDTIKEYGRGEISKQELVDRVEANNPPELAEAVVNTLNGRDVLIDVDELLTYRAFRKHIPRGHTVAEYMRTAEGSKILQVLKDEMELARKTQEEILAADSMSPEAILQREMIEQDRTRAVSLSQVDRLTVPDTIKAMQEIVSNPRHFELNPEEEIITSTSRVDVYRPNDEGKLIKQRFTLSSPLQHALFYANRSGSGPITGKRRLSIDFLQKHYPQYTDTQIEQIARAFRLELQRPDYRFNAERVIREREVSEAAVSPEKLRTRPALREAIGEDALRFKHAIEALTTRVVSDPNSVQFNRTAYTLMRAFKPNAETGRNSIAIYQEQAVQTIASINARLKELAKLETLTDDQKTAILVLEMSKERWGQIQKDSFSDLAVRISDFADRAFGPNPTITVEQYDKVMQAYQETASLQRLMSYNKLEVQHVIMNMPMRERQGSRMVDPEDQYSLGAAFLSDSPTAKADVLKMLYENTKIPFIDSLVKAGKIKVVETPKDITHGNHPEDVLGMYDRRTDTTYVVAGNVSSAAQLDTLIMHEATHAELPKILGKKAYRELMDSAFVNKDFREFKKEVIETYGLDPLENRDVISEEILARAVENYGGSHPLTATLLSAFKAWLYKIFGGNLIKLSQADLAHIVARSLRKRSEEAYIKYIDGPSIFDEVPKGHTDYELYSLVSKVKNVASMIPRSNRPPLDISQDVGAGAGFKAVGSNLVYQMETSNNPVVRLAGKMLFTNRDQGTIGTAEVHRRVTKEAKATIQAGYASSFDKFREELGVNFVKFHTPQAIEQHKRFANDIGRTALLKDTSYSDAVNNSVAFTYTQLKRVQDMVVAEREAVEKVLKRKLDKDDPLAELADQILDPDYIPTKINADKLEVLRAELKDDNGIVAFIADSITTPGMSSREKLTYSAALFKALINSSNPDTRRAVDSMFSGASNTAHVMKLTGLYTKTEIDAIQNMQIAARKSSKPLFDARHTGTVGNEFVALIDILETDLNVMLDSFITPRVSAISLGQSLRSGITSLDLPYEATMPSYLIDVEGTAHLNLNQTAGQDFLRTLAAESVVKDAPDIHERQMKILDNTLRLVTGGQFDDSPDGLGYDFLGVMSNVQNMAAGWGFSLSLIPEFFKVMGGVAGKESFKAWLSDLTGMFKNGAGNWDNQLARDIADFIGVGFDATALPKYDAQVGTNKLKDFNKLTGLAVKGTFKMSGFTNFNEYNQYLAVRAHLTQMKQMHQRGGVTSPEIKEHMILNGIPEDKINRALEYVARMYDEGSGTLSKSNKGFEDVDVYVKSYLNMVGTLAKSEAPVGSMPMLAYSKAGQIFLQYKSSIISSFVVNTLHDAKHFNRATATSWMFQFVGGALSYIAASILRYHSDDEKLKKNLTTENILKQAFGRASFAGLVPLIADAMAVLTGFKPIFSGAQYRDTFTFTPPALRSIADVVSGVAGISKTVNPFSEDPNTMERNTAMKMLGAAPLLSYGMGPVIFGGSDDK